MAEHRAVSQRQLDDPQVSAAYQALPDEGPSAELDAAILAAARAAVVQPAVVPLRRPRWLVPLSLAASLMLAIGVGWQVQRQQATPAHLSEEAAPEMAMASEVSANFAAASSSTESAAAPTAAQPTPSKQVEPLTAAPAAPEPAKRAAPLAEAPAAAARPATQPVIKLAAKEKTESTTQDKAVTELQAPVAETATAETRTLNPAPQPELDMAPRASMAPAPKPDARNRMDVTASAHKPEQAPVVELEKKRIAKAPIGNATPQGDNPPPMVWLQQIRQLRQQGKLNEAEQSLQRFRKAYPDYALPPDLLAGRAASAP